MKLINDTLKNPNGKWSRKSLAAFACFRLGLLAGVHIIASDFYMPEGKELNAFVYPVFLTLLGTGTAALGLTVWDKIKMRGSIDE